MCLQKTWLRKKLSITVLNINPSLYDLPLCLKIADVTPLGFLPLANLLGVATLSLK
jgi:hypothetical protein